MNCLHCDNKLFGRRKKFCCRKCQNTFNTRKRLNRKDLTTLNGKECIKCSKLLIGLQRKFCCRSHQLSWNNKHKYNYAAQRAYRSMSPRNYLSQLRSYYNRGETLSLDFLEDLYNIQNGKCAISSEILTFTQGTGRCPTNISIDRIDSKKGYEPDNVQLVCHKVNIMKAELSVEDLKDWCKKILNG